MDKKLYCFYGWETATAPAIIDRYAGIKTPIDLYDALSKVWSAETCAPRMRANWTPENMTLGQCSITAFLAQDIFGGDVYGILRPGGNYHCYNVIGDCLFDLTSEQFGEETLIYKENPLQTREIHFAKEEKRLRYEKLKADLFQYCNRRKWTSKLYPVDSLKQYKYVVVLSEYNGKILLSRHNERTTWETQGGHVEQAESPLEAAKRELYEESGALEYEIKPLCDYKAGVEETEDWGTGMVFHAVIHKLGEIPESEMAEVREFDVLPKNLTYPQIVPELFRYLSESRV